jgi:hypothetical protein
MAERVLVCILAQTRAHEITWNNFRRNVLEEIGADLAICVGFNAEYDPTNLFHRHAQYRWLLPEPADFASEIDRASGSLGLIPSWRELLVLDGEFLGAAAGRRGSGAVQLVFRWFLRECILREKLTERYDRFIITRSDFLYVTPYPCPEALDRDAIWFPDGEDYGGLVDRHMVVSSGDVVASLGVLGDLISYPADWVNDLSFYPHRNIEACLHNYFRRLRLLARVRRFPYIMYSVGGEKDKTRWSSGHFVESLGYWIKYPSEVQAALSIKDALHSQGDWMRWAQQGLQQAAQ